MQFIGLTELTEDFFYSIIKNTNKIENLHEWFELILKIAFDLNNNNILEILKFPWQVI